MPLALVVTGCPAAGKSTLGLALARELGAALVDLDSATAPLVSVVLGLMSLEDLDELRDLGRRDPDALGLADRTRAARYETVTALAEDSLRAGTPVVVVAPFTRERRDPDAWAALARRLEAAGGEPHLVWISMPAAVALSRLQARGAERDRRKIADVSTYLAGLDLAPPTVEHILVHGEGALTTQVSAVLTAL